MPTCPCDRPPAVLPFCLRGVKGDNFTGEPRRTLPPLADTGDESALSSTISRGIVAEEPLRFTRAGRPKQQQRLRACTKGPPPPQTHAHTHARAHAHKQHKQQTTNGNVASEVAIKFQFATIVFATIVVARERERERESLKSLKTRSERDRGEGESCAASETIFEILQRTLLATLQTATFSLCAGGMPTHVLSLGFRFPCPNAQTGFWN